MRSNLVYSEMSQFSARAVIMVYSMACLLMVGRHAGQAQAHRADVGVGRGAGIVREQRQYILLFVRSCDVHLQPDDGLVFYGRG